MSSASIIVRQPKRRVASIKALRPVLGLSIAVLVRGPDEGGPIIEAELFLNDFADWQTSSARPSGPWSPWATTTRCSRMRMRSAGRC